MSMFGLNLILYSSAIKFYIEAETIGNESRMSTFDPQLTFDWLS